MLWQEYWNYWEWSWSSSTTRVGTLIDFPFAEAGGFYNFDPLSTSSASLIQDDEQALRDCCVDSCNCRAYHQVRVVNTCSSYVPPPIVSKCSPYSQYVS